MKRPWQCRIKKLKNYFEDRVYVNDWVLICSVFEVDVLFPPALVRSCSIFIRYGNCLFHMKALEMLTFFDIIPYTLYLIETQK